MLVALALAAAAPARAAKAPAAPGTLDIDRWDEFMQTADSASTARLAPRDSSQRGAAWLEAAAGRSAVTRRDRRWIAGFRRALDEVGGVASPCLCTEQCWGCVGAEPSVTLATFHRRGATLRVALLAREHCAVFALDGEPQGCARLDLGAPPWAELLGLPADSSLVAAAAEPAAGQVFDAMPRALVQAAAGWPAEARSMGVTGTVRVKALVGPDGNVRGAVALDGPESLREAAIDALRQWRFEPARAGGRPVAAWVLVPVSFP